MRVSFVLTAGLLLAHAAEEKRGDTACDPGRWTRRGIPHASGDADYAAATAPADQRGEQTSREFPVGARDLSKPRTDLIWSRVSILRSLVLIAGNSRKSRFLPTPG
jgi:hypothetical protein